MKKRPQRPSQVPSVDSVSENAHHPRPVAAPAPTTATSEASAAIPTTPIPNAPPNQTSQQAPPKLSILSSILKPMKTMKILKTTSTSTVSLSEADRKRRLINNIPILSQAVHDFFVNEQTLVDALQINSYVDKEVIFRQGHTSRDIFFIEEGHVNIVQKKYVTVSSTDLRGGFQHTAVTTLDSDVHIRTYKGGDCFGEVALLQSASRNSSAIAEGKVSCMMLREEAYRTLLAPMHQLLLYRYFLRVHSVLEKLRIFKEFAPLQLQYLVDHSFLERFNNGDYLCRQGELEDRYFIVAEGEALVTFNDPETRHDKNTRCNDLDGGDVNADGDGDVDAESCGRGDGDCRSDDGRHKLRKESVKQRQSVVEKRKHDAQDAINCIVTNDADTKTKSLGQKKVFESFGEMGLLGKPRSANVIACGPVLCLVLTRKTYQEAMAIGNNGLDADTEALMANSLIEEWNLTKAAMNLHISNPHVATKIVMFIKKFKESYNQKFAGKTTYMQLFRRLQQDPDLRVGMTFINERIDWESPLSSLSIIRSETQRILNSPESGRSIEELSFLGRLLEMTNFLNKFDMPPKIHRFRVAQYLGRVLKFCTIKKDAHLFHQGNEECKAFVILRGKINIVNEDMSTIGSPTSEHPSLTGIRQELLATLLAGESFGELALITVMKRSASAIAAADADLLVIDRKGLNSLMAALPGVTVRHMMAKRAEYLSQLNCFKHCDVSRRIRIAHDMQENTFEPRYIFFQDPNQQKTVFFVKSGEVSVFLRKSRSLLNRPDTVNLQQQQVLVKVATIGAHEFFDASELKDTGSLWSSDSSLTSEWNESVYMCDTRVHVLELAEKGWRRLDLTTLRSMRSALLERNRWHHQVLANAQTNQRELLCFQVDKPWIAIGRNVGHSLVDEQSPHLQTSSYHSTALAVQLKAREATKMDYAQYFPQLQSERQKLLDRMPTATTDKVMMTRSPEHTIARSCPTASVPQRPSSPSAIRTAVGGRKAHALGGSFVGVVGAMEVSPTGTNPNAAG